MVPDRPSDPPLRTATTLRGQFCYTDEGRGTAILAVHGLPGSSRDFRWLGTVLEPEARLIRLDMPGYGQTPLTSGPQPSARGRAQFVMRAADALELDRFVVLGHSIGGPVALEVAARNPERVAGLALLASVGLRPHILLRRFSPKSTSLAMRVPPLRWLLVPRMRAAFRRSGFSEGTPDQEMVQSVHCAAALDFDRNRDNVERLQVPTFLSWAADDPLVEDEVSAELAAACNGAEKLRFDEGGHNIQKTQAVEIGAALTRWSRLAAWTRVGDP